MLRNYQHNKIATPELTSYHYGKSYVEQEHRSKISPICHYKLLLLTILPALQRSLQTKSFSVLPNLLWRKELAGVSCHCQKYGYFIYNAKKKKIEMIEKLASIKEAGSRFSISLDEYTSTRNRKYFNINLNSKAKLFCLGLVM